VLEVEPAGFSLLPRVALDGIHAAKAAGTERRDDAGNVDDALADGHADARAGDPSANGELARGNVLQVHVHDALRETFQERDGVAAGEEEVPRVEVDAEVVRVVTAKHALEERGIDGQGVVEFEREPDPQLARAGDD